MKNDLEFFMFDDLSLVNSWSWGVVAVLLLLAALYLLALRHVWVRASVQAQERPLRAYQVGAFFLGLLLAGLLLLSPINTIGRTQLFSVHMAQAILLTTACAPLLLAGCPALLLRPLTYSPVVKAVVGFLLRPLVASVLFNITFLLWHAPRIYNAAMTSPALYHTMMLSIFLLSLLNWWPLIGSLEELRRMSYPMQMVYAFFDGQPVDIFAFILVFTGTPIYTHYHIPPQLGLSSFADQALGGALLLIPGLVDLAVMSPLFIRWLRQVERSTRVGDERRQQALLEEDGEYDEGEDEDTIDNSRSTNHTAP